MGQGFVDPEPEYFSHRQEGNNIYSFFIGHSARWLGKVFVYSGAESETSQSSATAMGFRGAELKVFFTGQNPNQALKNSDPTSMMSIAIGLGHTLATDMEDNPQVLICVDWTTAARRLIRKARLLNIPTVLVINEPLVVTPEHGNPKVHLQFTNVYEVGRPFASPFFKWPQAWNLKYFDNSERHNGVVAISANKFSFVPGELYSLRSRAYANLSDPIDVYGVGWDRPKFANLLKLGKDLQLALKGGQERLTFACVNSFRLKPTNLFGQVEDKLLTMSGYKVSLVIENSSDYMSEKLIDSLLAGAIPVYVGPSVEAFGIPEELVVPAEPNLDSIARAISFAREMDYAKWHERARKWVTDPGVRKSWEARNVMRSILETVELEISSK